MGVGLFAPIIGGLYVRRARTSDAMCAIVAGVGTVAVLHFGYVGQRVLGLTPTMAGLAAAVTMFIRVMTPQRTVNGKHF